MGVNQSHYTPPDGYVLQRFEIGQRVLYRSPHGYQLPCTIVSKSSDWDFGIVQDRGSGAVRHVKVWLLTPISHQQQEVHVHHYPGQPQFSTGVSVGRTASGFSTPPAQSGASYTVVKQAPPQYAVPVHHQPPPQPYPPQHQQQSYPPQPQQQPYPPQQQQASAPPGYTAASTSAPPPKYVA
eukprot:m.321673 g.321673  ORF g.321673 m.321673 type:complete len:181 (-) comp16001_c1_seq3:975-1517(-)